MASVVYAPFNFNPDSTTFKTSSYTVPSGFYGEVETLCGDITLNSILFGNLITSGDLTAGTTVCCFGYAFYTAVISYTGNVGTKSVSIDSVGVGTTGAFSASLSGTTVNNTTTFYGGSCNVVRSITGGAITSGNITVYSCPKIKFRVKSGDIINGSKFVVTLFRQAT